MGKGQSKTKQPREKAQSSSEMSVYRSSAEESVRQRTIQGLSIYKGSDEYFENICGPCGTAGDRVEARGFCVNCEDYLCDICFRSHSRNKASRNHTLLDKDNMMTMADPFYGPSKTANEEGEAAWYCTNCDDHMCSTCYRCHARGTGSKHRVLLDKDKMPKKGKGVFLASADEKLNIDKRDIDSENNVHQYAYIQDINVVSADDEKDCYIIAMATVSNDELILLDLNNKSIKLIDVENGIIKNDLKLEEKPVGLAMISKDQAAVVLQNKCKIIIISVSKGLSVLRTLNTNGESIDVEYFNEKMYVSFREPVKFQILHPTGAVYKTIKPDPEVLQYCTLPRYIAVSSDESMIYISDWKNNNMLSIDMNGKLVSTFSGELDQPHDVTISPSGSVYLCNRKQDVVYKMTSDLREATVILGQKDGLFSPMAMCLNFNKKNIFISSGSKGKKYCNFLKVYSWK